MPFDPPVYTVDRDVRARHCKVRYVGKTTPHSLVCAASLSVDGVGAEEVEVWGGAVRYAKDAHAPQVATWQALLLGLCEALEHGFSAVTIMGYDEIVTNQVRGDFLVRSPKIQPLYDLVSALNGTMYSVDVLLTSSASDLDCFSSLQDATLESQAVDAADVPAKRAQHLLKTFAKISFYGLIMDNRGGCGGIVTQLHSGKEDIAGAHVNTPMEGGGACLMYEALLQGLLLALQLGMAGVMIYCPNPTLAGQITRVNQVRAPSIVALHSITLTLLSRFHYWSIVCEMPETSARNIAISACTAGKHGARLARSPHNAALAWMAEHPVRKQPSLSSSSSSSIEPTTQPASTQQAVQEAGSAATAATATVAVSKGSSCYSQFQTARIAAVAQNAAAAALTSRPVVVPGSSMSMPVAPDAPPNAPAARTVPTAAARAQRGGSDDACDGVGTGASWVNLSPRKVPAGSGGVSAAAAVAIAAQASNFLKSSVGRSAGSALAANGTPVVPGNAIPTAARTMSQRTAAPCAVAAAVASAGSGGADGSRSSSGCGSGSVVHLPTIGIIDAAPQGRDEQGHRVLKTIDAAAVATAAAVQSRNGAKPCAAREVGFVGVGKWGVAHAAEPEPPWGAAAKLKEVPAWDNWDWKATGLSTGATGMETRVGYGIGCRGAGNGQQEGLQRATAGRGRDNKSREVDCSLCLDSLLSRAIACPPCGHIFHLDCLNQMLAGNPRCPVCARECKATATLKLYC